MNKLKEYMRKNNIDSISIPHYPDGYFDKKKRFGFIKGFGLHSNFSIGEYRFMLTEEQFNVAIKFLTQNKIKNDGGFLFGDMINLSIYCNKVWILAFSKALKQFEC